MNALRTQLTRNILLPKSRAALKPFILSTALTTITTTATTVTFCENSNDNNNNNTDLIAKLQTIISSNNNLNIDIDLIGKLLGSNVQEAIDSGVPTQISYGFICGYSSGYALKKVGKLASGVFGLGFVALQSLAYAGYIEINHSALKEDVERALDLNKDGKIDGDDADILYNQVMEVLQFNMTGGSGFAAGFLGGFKSG